MGHFPRHGAGSTGLFAFWAASRSPGAFGCIGLQGLGCLQPQRGQSLLVLRAVQTQVLPEQKCKALGASMAIELCAWHAMLVRDRLTCSGRLLDMGAVSEMGRHPGFSSA